MLSLGSRVETSRAPSSNDASSDAVAMPAYVLIGPRFGRPAKKYAARSAHPRNAEDEDRIDPKDEMRDDRREEDALALKEPAPKKPRRYDE